MSKTDRHLSLICQGSQVSGDVFITGSWRVDGTIKGAVKAINGQAATLVVGEMGCVEGEIEVSKLVIHGQAKGVVTASESIELTSAARVHGDIHYRSAQIHAGAVVLGQLFFLGELRSPLVAVKAHEVE
jgi:cytoskeletal protein CcmA (bactofilin family)